MKINKCKYCGDMPKQTTHEGRNRIGRLGFVSVCFSDAVPGVPSAC